ncbi:MAG: starch-binding protein, partial [Muribaculaceae bacterium]|nr:starch-binding protein [Muribaculaceae bacterium]
GKVHAYVWNDNPKKEHLGAWPGTQMVEKTDIDGIEHYYIQLDEIPDKIIFNNGSGGNGNQTDDFAFEHEGVYSADGKIKTLTGVFEIENADDAQNEEVKIFNLQGVQVTNPGPGMYIVVRGKKVSKIRIK